MAAAYRSSTSTSTGAGTAGSLALDLPSGVQPNDVLLAVITVDGGTSSTITAPSGWTTLRATTQSTNTRQHVYWRLANGQETSTYTWTFDTTRAASGAFLAYSGVHPFPPSITASTSSGTATTTLTAATMNTTYESGQILQIISTRNTTAASSITAGSGYTKREDVTTTASAFMNTAVEDQARGLNMGGTTAATTTSAQSVAYISMVLFLEDARPAFTILQEDEFVVGSGTASASSFTSAASVQTNFPNTLLLLFVTINKDLATVSSISGGLTWTNVGRANTNTGSCEVWRTFVATPISAQQLTINTSSAVVSINYMMASFVGVDLTGSNGSGAIGAVATGTSTTAAPTLNLVTTRNNSWVWSGFNAAGITGTPTAGTGQTVLRNLNDATNTAVGWFSRQNALTATSGTTVTSNATAPTTGSCNIISVEVLPAIYHHLGATGAGG